MCSPACPPSTLQGNSATLPRCIFQMLPRQQHELDTGKKALYCIYIYNIMNRYLNTMNLPFLFVLHFLLKFIFQMCTHNINITTTYITTMYITKPNLCIYVCIIYMYYIYICMYYIYVCMIYIYYIYLYVLYIYLYISRTRAPPFLVSSHFACTFASCDFTSSPPATHPKTLL